MDNTEQWIDVPGYQGPLDKLVIGAQRGEIDLSTLPVAQITGEFRRRLGGPEPRPGLTEVADFLTLAARLVALKASVLLPDAEAGEPQESETDPEAAAGERLAEYRLFKAAVDSLLSDADDGFQSFLGLVVPEVLPVERLRITPDRLAAALRTVIERIREDEPVPLGVVTFSVRELAERLRSRLRGGRSLRFEELFAGMTSRLEAVACFLALLQLLSGAQASVEQRTPFGPIMVTGRG